jgi:hypothetical protein
VTAMLNDVAAASYERTTCHSWYGPPAVAIANRQLVRPNDEHSIYELHLDNGQEIVKVQFSVDGAVLNQSAKPKDVASLKPGAGMSHRVAALGMAGAVAFGRRAQDSVWTENL